MKSILEIVNEGYWGCEPFLNDYVLDEQSEMYATFYNKVISKVKYNQDYEALYHNISIAIDFFERMHGTEVSQRFERNKLTKELFIKCLDKVYEGYKGTWVNSTNDEKWLVTINKLKKKVNKIFK